MAMHERRASRRVEVERRLLRADDEVDPGQVLGAPRRSPRALGSRPSQATSGRQACRTRRWRPDEQPKSRTRWPSATGRPQRSSASANRSAIQRSPPAASGPRPIACTSSGGGRPRSPVFVEDRPRRRSARRGSASGARASTGSRQLPRSRAQLGLQPRRRTAVEVGLVRARRAAPATARPSARRVLRGARPPRAARASSARRRSRRAVAAAARRGRTRPPVSSDSIGGEQPAARPAVRASRARVRGSRRSAAPRA